MRLNITTKGLDSDFDGETFNLPISSLESNSVHLFIASHRWDTMYVELGDTMPLNVFKYMVTQVDKVLVKLPDKPSQHVMKLMCELYPDRSGMIRKLYMMGKDMKGAVV